jgi:hypothetical protein
VRYADDFILGFIGSIAEAREIKDKLEVFMEDSLNMKLSKEKTLITHAKSHAAKFLGYEIIAQHENTKHTNGRRSVNGRLGLRIPAKFIKERCARFMRKGKSVHRPELSNESDFSIVYDYQSKYRGYVQYYKLAVNLSQLHRLHWVMQTSLFKTLASKHKSSVSKMARKYLKTVRFPHGLRRCVEVMVAREGKKPLVTRFGGLSLKREERPVIVDMPIDTEKPARCELLARLLADQCEICGATNNIVVHHVRALKDLKVKGKKEKPLWMQIMSARKRKTLVVCHKCHVTIHNGQLVKKQADTEQNTGRAV